MAFKGTLREFKVPDILQLISLQKKTGVLTFTSPEGFITFIIEDGMIVGVDAFPRKIETRVGNVLVKQDLISKEMLERSLDIQKKKGKKIGEILLEMQIIEEDTIDKALKNQAVEIILSLFKWKSGEYNFKVMEFIDSGMKSLEPIEIDGLIMEGVQMLDEWPLITELVPNDNIIFEPTEIESKNIEIIDETADEMSSTEKVFLNETEVGLLKYINGKNRVKDLVELGVFTKYKVYKSLYNLIQKKIIQKKERSAIDDFEKNKSEELLYERIDESRKKINYVFYFLIIFLLLMFLVNFFSPFEPFFEGNILIDQELIDVFL